MMLSLTGGARAHWRNVALKKGGVGLLSGLGSINYFIFYSLSFAMLFGVSVVGGRCKHLSGCRLDILFAESRDCLDFGALHGTAGGGCLCQIERLILVFEAKVSRLEALLISY